MTDVVEVEGATPSRVLTISISRGRAGEVDVNTERVAEYIYIDSLKRGLQFNLGRGTSKIDKNDKPAIMKQVQTNLEAMYAGTMVIRGAKAKGDKVPTEVMSLARNMARAIVKAELKKKGFKISLVKSTVITKAANLLLTQRPELIKKAADDLAAQAEEEQGDVTAGITEDPELKAKAAKAKAEKQLSAAKAGKVASRGRPGLNA